MELAEVACWLSGTENVGEWYVRHGLWSWHWGSSVQIFFTGGSALGKQESIYLIEEVETDGCYTNRVRVLVCGVCLEWCVFAM